MFAGRCQCQGRTWWQQCCTCPGWRWSVETCLRSCLWEVINSRCWRSTRKHLRELSHVTRSVCGDCISSPGVVRSTVTMLAWSSQGVWIIGLGWYLLVVWSFFYLRQPTTIRLGLVYHCNLDFDYCEKYTSHSHVNLIVNFMMWMLLNWAIDWMCSCKLLIYVSYSDFF